MPNSLGASALASFQSSVSVLLTLSYGVAAEIFNVLDEQSVHKLSLLCINVFLPALYVVQIGPELSFSQLKLIAPLFLWSLICINLGALIGWIGKRVLSFSFPHLKFRNWVIAASASNNGNAMPLLLLSALGTTTALNDILGDGENVEHAVSRGKGFVLIYALVQQTWTFVVVPHLLDGDKSALAEENNNEDEQVGLLEEYDGNESDPDQRVLSLETVVQQSKRKFSRVARVLKPRTLLSSIFQKCRELTTPPIVGILLALLFGLAPPLHSLFLNKTSPLYSSVTSSVKNIGELFTSLQMVALGGQLYESWKCRNTGERSPVKPFVASFILIFLVRFILLPVFSISGVYLMVKKGLVPNDPMLWFIMMIVPCGPPALTLGALAEVVKSDKQDISMCLIISYILSPLISIAVTASLRVASQIS